MWRGWCLWGRSSGDGISFISRFNAFLRWRSAQLNDKISSLVIRDALCLIICVAAMIGSVVPNLHVPPLIFGSVLTIILGVRIVYRLLQAGNAGD